jgi:hypothetical protein
MTEESGSVPAFVLVVETPNGLYTRRIPDASPLVSGLEQGVAAEHATQSAVARWGLPDFVYRSVVRRLGSGTRELGDALLLVGRRAVVVQVKSRHAAGKNKAREESWIRKNAARALRQAHGTIRSLRTTPHEMVNLRNREIRIEGRLLEWLAVIVIDHPDAPEEITVSNPHPELPGIVLLRRDWEFLFDQLRSTHAVVAYLHRAAADDHSISLGEEPARYYMLAQADAEAPPSGGVVFSPGGRPVSAPLLPLAPAGHDDTHAHMLLRAIMEDVAITPIPEEITEHDRLLVLAELDEMPVAHRTELGQTLFEMMRIVAEAPQDMIVWRFRRIRAARGKPHLMFGVCNREHDELINEAFIQFVMLRHHEFGEDLGGNVDDLHSVGILLTPRPRSSRPWDTTMVHVSGDLGLTPSEVNQIRRFWQQ